MLYNIDVTLDHGWGTEPNTAVVHIELSLAENKTRQELSNLRVGGLQTSANVADLIT